MPRRGIIFVEEKTTPYLRTLFLAPALTIRRESEKATERLGDLETGGPGDRETYHLAI